MAISSTDTARHWVLIPAAGCGRRMGSQQPKQYLTLAGYSVLEHVLRRFGDCAQIDGIMLVLAADDPYWPQLKVRIRPPLWTTPGADERCRSVWAGLQALQDMATADDWVLVHDAARPCLHPQDLHRLLETVQNDAVGGLLAVPARDTIKRADSQGRVVATEDRSMLWQAQTPQMFRYGLLCQALQTSFDQGYTVTDEASAIERLGYAPRLVPSQHTNLKLTTPDDLAYAEYCLQQSLTTER